MTQADNLINHCSTLSAVLVITRVVELGVFRSPLGPRWSRILPIRPIPFRADPVTSCDCASLFAPFPWPRLVKPQAGPTGPVGQALERWRKEHGVTEVTDEKRAAGIE